MDNNVFYFPWVRKGLGTYIDEKDSLGQDGVALGRPGLTIKSNYTARHNQPADADADETSQIILEKTVVFSGPGDVVDVKPNAVMKVHPEEGSEGFPAKYLPYIEFWGLPGDGGSGTSETEGAVRHRGVFQGIV